MSREALIVLGMHRSGTSVTAGLLVRLGAQAPTTLMPADASNPEGYCESMRLWELHERLLHEAGSRWDSYARLDLGRLQSSISSELTDAFRLALHAEFDDAPRFVLKDPRMCRFVPFWLRVLEKEAIAPAAVLVVRDPLEVAQSLGTRNGLERDLSLLMWLRHVLDAELHTRTIRRSFVRYRELLKDWRLVAQRVSRDLKASWGTRTPAEEAEIDRFVNAGLRHHRAKLDSHDVEPVLSEWLHRTSAGLQSLHDDDTRRSSACSELDAVRLELDRATSAFSIDELIRRSLETQVGGLQSQVGNLQVQTGNLQAQAERAEIDRRSLLEQAAELEASRISLRQRVSALEEHSEALQRQLQAFEQDRGILQRALSDAHQDAKALRESGSWRITAPLRAVYRLLR